VIATADPTKAPSLLVRTVVEFSHRPGGSAQSSPVPEDWAVEPLAGRTIAIVGLGYVGLPTALSLADRGASVIGFDVSEARLSAIKANQVDLLDRDRQRLARHLDDQRLLLTIEAAELSRADAVLVCVPTPIDIHLVPDLTTLSAACATVVQQAVSGQTIVLTSTTYAGCTRDLLASRLEARGLRVGVDVFVAFSPERIDPGVENHSPEQTPRVVGGVTARCTERALDVLQHTAATMHVVSSPEAAELTKLLENTFRAVNIALANEFSGVASALNVDALEVIRAAATKPYGFMPFYPGPGVGGHCIPCDPHYLLWQLKARRQSLPVVEAAMTAIARRPRDVVAYARQVLGDTGEPLRGARVLVVGVTYKPGVADVRESPALEILSELAEIGADVAYHDPLVPQAYIAGVGPLSSEPEPTATAWDLVLVHTLQPGHDYDWIASCPAVLDTTYQLEDVAHRHVL
jgi:UDP-N-acetyl-D-glucosamine dehydrogenase